MTLLDGPDEDGDECIAAWKDVEREAQVRLKNGLGVRAEARRACLRWFVDVRPRGQEQCGSSEIDSR